MDQDSRPAGSFTLLEAIQRFDRRERRAVIRMLGGEDAVLVSDRTAEVLARELERPDIDFRHATWFMDYPWNWMVAAVTVFSTQSYDFEKAYANPTDLILDNQEDVDALIVAGNHLVLVEAKWHGPWNLTQLERKASRINAFANFLKSSGSAERITWQVALSSRKKDSPESAVESLKKYLAASNGVPVVALPFDHFFTPPSDLLEVPYVKKGTDWKIKKSRGWWTRRPS